MKRPNAMNTGKPDYTGLDLPEPPSHRPYVLINMVMSVDGKVVIGDTERGLGSKTDQRLMRELRVNADIVLNGASTLRASGTSSRLGDAGLEDLRERRGMTRCPVAAVISRSGNLPLDRAFFTARDFEAVVYLSSSASRERREAAVATGRTVYEVAGGEEIPAMLRHMRRELDCRVLLVEGGPTVNAQLFAFDAADEFFLTIGALVVGGEETLTVVEGAAAFPPAAVKRLQLLSAYNNTETQELYLRYRASRQQEG
jgi:2,5-diamino-6-(ribosylamino)-4(3H)-pyrimidinone 5'-phosphate reductase